MISSLRKIVDLNPINKMYGKLTKGITDFIVGGSSSPKNGFVALLDTGDPTDDGWTYMFYQFVPNNIPIDYYLDEETETYVINDYSIYADGEQVNPYFEGVMTLDDEMLAEVNAFLQDLGSPYSLDENYIGGTAIVGVVFCPYIAGEHTLEFDYNEYSYTTTYNSPVYYFVNSVDVSDGMGGTAFTYYVAYRNTLNEDYWTDTWDYTQTHFYLNSEATDNVCIGEQDPGYPVTWYVSDAYNDMTDECKAKFACLQGCVGYELNVIPPVVGDVYFEYGDEHSFHCDFNVPE